MIPLPCCGVMIMPACFEVSFFQRLEGKGWATLKLQNSFLFMTCHLNLWLLINNNPKSKSKSFILLDLPLTLQTPDIHPCLSFQWVAFISPPSQAQCAGLCGDSDLIPRTQHHSLFGGQLGIQPLASPLSCTMTLGKILFLSLPRFPHLWSGENAVPSSERCHGVFLKKWSYVLICLAVRGLCCCSGFPLAVESGGHPSSR